MSRRKKHAAHENHERWLVSYADFITLLFAFFVVMFATSHADRGKQETVSIAVKEALDQGALVTTIAGFLGKSKEMTDIHLPEAKPYQGAKEPPKDPDKSATENAAQAAVIELLPSLQSLTSELQTQIEDGKLEVSLEPRGLVVSLREASFFAPGNDRVNPESFAMLEKVAEAIRKLPNPVRLEGHTDSKPVSNRRFRSNWELSAARSIAMLELLATRYQIPREKMAISGYADTAPVASNDNEEGRAQNRRVDIIILNQFGVTNEPGKYQKKPAEAASAPEAEKEGGQ
jgi:chemotaxis protein MotB